MAYVPVSGAEQFQFPCMVVFNGFYSNWFKLVLARPPYGQTFNQTNIFVSTIKIFGYSIFSFFDMIMSTALKVTQRERDLGFLNITEFYRRCNFGCLCHGLLLKAKKEGEIYLSP